MSDTHHSDLSHSEEHSHTKLFMTVFFALVVLTALSFWAGMYVAEYAVMRLVMIVISCCKAMLVILFFMHLKWEANWKYVLTVPAMLMSVYLLCMLIPDVGLRTERYSAERIWRAADKAHPAVEDGEHIGEHTDDHGSQSSEF